MTNNEQVKQLWRLTHDLLFGPARATTQGSHMLLPPRFDEDLLNSVASLKEAPDTELAQRVEEVRAKFGIAQATGLLGEKDLEEINRLLDKLIGEQ